MSEELPAGWARARLDDVLWPLEDGRTLHHGWSPQCEKQPAQPGAEWGVLKTTAVQPGAFLPQHNKRLPAHLAPRPQLEVKPGDMLITCAGPRSRCGIPCLVRGTFERLMISGKMYRFRVGPNHFDSRYLEQYLLSSEAQNLIDSMKTGGSDSGLNLTHERFRPLPLPVAPLNEQRRIASKIDELFSRIDEGERALERVQALVERYRQSVLKAAVTGELTREWREQRRGQLESGEVLLGRILQARRDAWEAAELERMRARGVTPADDRWKQKYKEPVAPDTSELPGLADGWVWASVEQLCFVDTGATPKRGTAKYYDGGTVDWITSAAVNEPIIRSAGERITDIAIRETNAKVFPAGTLIVAMYGEGKTRGKVSELGIAAATNQACAALLCSHVEHAIKQYLRIFIEASYTLLRSAAAGGVQPNLNLGIINRTVVPLPGLTEAALILEVVEKQLTHAARQSRELSSWSKWIEVLRQKILARAFSGNLVPQDPTDEPASVLLERIAAERAAAPTPKRGRRKVAQEKR